MFCLTVTKHSVEEHICAVFLKIPVAKKFIKKRGEEREYQDIPSKSFYLTVPKFFVAECFSVSSSLGIEKIWG